MTAIVFAIGYKSGAHVNPAVTVAYLITKRMRFIDGIFYIVFQIIGGIMAAAVVFTIFGSAISSSVTLPADDNVLRAFTRNSNDFYMGIHSFNNCCNRE